MQMLILDFEGCHSKGIREIGAVFTQGIKITKIKELTVDNVGTCRKTLSQILVSSPELFVSHNIQIEKNLLKKYLPYPPIIKDKDSHEWGPWLDTIKLYKTLYPDLKKYELSSLKDIFIKDEIEILSTKYCTKGKGKHHNALYDAMCTYLLVKRLYSKIDLNSFIQ